MPTTKAAKKALRQTKKQTAQNSAKKKRIKELTKDFLKAVETKAPEAHELLQKTTQALDKSAKTHTIHKNRASRQKSALQKKFNTAFKTTAAK
ncbi:MAG TPA: 30S ribosomal protein S20 [Patescibacteria group bacterium]|nr:30S ribosomal protein S20 [Patescibacteria group bacterium]